MSSLQDLSLSTILEQQKIDSFPEKDSNGESGDGRVLVWRGPIGAVAVCLAGRGWEWRGLLVPRTAHCPAQSANSYNPNNTVEPT